MFQWWRCLMREGIIVLVIFILFWYLYIFISCIDCICCSNGMVVCRVWYVFGVFFQFMIVYVFLFGCQCGGIIIIGFFVLKSNVLNRVRFIGLGVFIVGGGRQMVLMMCICVFCDLLILMVKCMVVLFVDEFVSGIRMFFSMVLFFYWLL